MASPLRSSQIANAAALASTATYSFTADYNRILSVQAIWTATTASFALGLEYSNDGTTWQTFSSATVISNASGNVMWDVAGTKDALYWRVNAVRTSGTLTTLTVFVANIAR